MNTPVRLGLYGAGLVALFAAAFGIASAVAPDDVATRWAESTASGHADGYGPDSDVTGLALADGGYLLDTVTAPREPDAPGDLTFRILDVHGSPVTDYDVEHEKELHLIVVRSDGTHFRHLHPARDDTGTWTVPVEWAAAGTYRVYTDFTPAGATRTTLSRTVEVAGPVTPEAPAPTSVSTVDGFTVTLGGRLRTDTTGTLDFTVTHDGEPVTTLEPYLGAFGHLVALREGDLAYLHSHPHGGDVAVGGTSGPTVSFAVQAPTPGRYLLYLDFQVDGQVHTAAFAVDATDGADEHPHP